mmetsp:Transcript_69750/g.110646  ORF Transcript_69750/g.110646 Transcript_69750/m.110646 type:complete len:618 (-) Transcript_69750:68-1921(-)
MEVNIEAIEGLPPKSFIGVRMGSVQKQAPYDPKTLYRFPDVKRHGKIDIFQRIGSCDISWSCDDQETRVCKPVDTNSKGDLGMKFKVTMRRLGAAALKSSEAAEKAAAKNAKAEHTAKSAKYISDRGVEEMLTAAMRALLKQMPADAPEFLCSFIDTNYGSGQRKASQEAVATSEREPGKVGSKEYYRQHFLPSCQDYFRRMHSRSQWPDRRCQNPSSGKPKSSEDASKQKENRAALAEKLVTALQTGGLETAMMQLAWQADQSTELGSFEEFLECFKQKKAEAEEDRLRSQARTTLVEAARSGELRGVLTDLRADGNKEAVNLEELRQEMGKALTASALDGSLEKAMSADELREKMNTSLMASARDGSSQKASTSRALLRQELKQTMCEAAQDGTLLNALLEKNENQPAKTLNDLQTDLKQTMMAAASDGTLEKALVKQAEKQASKPSSLPEELTLSSDLLQKCIEVAGEECREKACRDLLAGAMNGSLQAILQELTGTVQKSPSRDLEESKIPQRFMKALVKVAADDLRVKAARKLLCATLSGSLHGVLERLSGERSQAADTSSAEAAGSSRDIAASRRLGPQTVEEKIWQVRPSVGTWLRPRRTRAAAFEDEGA